jgi:hypothetical protein
MSADQQKLSHPEPKIPHDALLTEPLVKLTDEDIKYYVYLEGPVEGHGILPWPRIVLKNKPAGSHEEGRVLHPEDADRLRTILISDVDTAFHGTNMERGYVSLHTHFGIKQSNKEFIKEIDQIYKRARPFLDRLIGPPTHFPLYDGYFYYKDPDRTKIITSEAADPRAVAVAGAGDPPDGGSRRRRPSRKYKKSKRVLRRKSRSTRRR